MKYALAIFALVCAVGVNGAPNVKATVSTAAQVKADVTSKIRIPQIAASGKVVDAILKTVTTTFTSDNKTIWSNVQSANKTIQGNVKSTVTVLSVTKWDALIAELILLNTAILSVQGQYDLFAIALTAQLSLTLTAQTAANTKFGDDVLTAFTAIETNVNAITNINVNTNADCIAAAVKSIAAFYKTFDDSQKTCFKDFDTANKLFISKGLTVWAVGNVSVSANLPIDTVKLCFKSNQVSDIKALETSNNCTKDAFTFCIDQSLPATATFTGSFQATFIDTTLAIYAANVASLTSCLGAAYQKGLDDITALGSTLVSCLTVA